MDFRSVFQVRLYYTPPGEENRRWVRFYPIKGSFTNYERTISYSPDKLLILINRMKMSAIKIGEGGLMVVSYKEE